MPPSPVRREPLQPVRRHSGRPLPVVGIVDSPGPAYTLPGGTGTEGPKITIKNRYYKEEELIPFPGPGEYNPSANWWPRSPGYSFGDPSPPKDEKEREELIRRHMAQRSQAFGTPRYASDEPGPDAYVDLSLSLSGTMKKRTGWRVEQMKEDDPRRVHKPGVSIGHTTPRGNSKAAFPGPGSYTPKLDARGGCDVAQAALKGGTNKGQVVHPPPKGDKRHEEFAAPGPGVYDTSQLTIAKQATAHPVTMMGRPFDRDPDPTPGPGQYTLNDKVQQKNVHGIAFGPAPPKTSPSRRPKPGAPGPGSYTIPSTIGKGPGVSIRQPTAQGRSNRLQFQRGEVVSVRLTTGSPAVQATIVETWRVGEAGTPTCRVQLESGQEREVPATNVKRWDGDGTGPGSYDPTAGTGIGRTGPRYTIQGPSPGTSLTGVEARRAKDSPGPSQYFLDGKYPHSIGSDGKKFTLGKRATSKQHNTDVGPGGGPSGKYNPKPPSDIQPYAEYQAGVTMAFRTDIRVKVLNDASEVERLCEEAGVIEYKGGKEWRSQWDTSLVTGEEIFKDEYCGNEGSLVPIAVSTHRFKQGQSPSKNSSSGKGRGGSPKSKQGQPVPPGKEVLRVVFDDGQVWHYPPSCLLRHGIPLPVANARWPIPGVKAPGGPAKYTPRNYEIGSSKNKITIKGRPQELATESLPGPGDYELPSTLSARGAFIGTSS